MHEITYHQLRCFSTQWNLRYLAVVASCRHLAEGQYCSDPTLTLIMN